VDILFAFRVDLFFPSNFDYPYCASKDTSVTEESVALAHKIYTSVAFHDVLAQDN